MLQPANLAETAHLFYDVKGARDFHQGRLPDAAQVGLHALAPSILRIELEQPTPYFLHLLTNFFPLPRQSVAVHGNNWAEAAHLVTNGPFRLSGRPAADALTLERNPAFAGAFTGNLRQITLRFFDDWAERLALYEADQLDVINLHPCPPPELAAVRQRHAAEFLSVPQLGTWYITFDVSRPPFDDERVRRAFVLATDRQTLVDLAWPGHATPATGGFLPPRMPGHSPQIGLPYQPRRAQQFLTEAGYLPGGSRPLPEIEALVPDTLAPKAEHLRAQWRDALGVDVAWRVVSWAEAEERLLHQPPHLSITGWGADYPDPDSFLRSGTLAYGTRWRCPDNSQMIAGARHTPNQAQRLALYQQADKMLIDQSPIMPLAYGQAGLLAKPWVTTYPTSALAIHHFFGKEIVIDPH